MAKNQSKTLFSAYDARVESGSIANDAAQREVLTKLEALAKQLESQKKRGLFSKFTNNQPLTTNNLYIWGGVGRGKSMLMDLFFAHVTLEKKRRVHFHAFMQEVHEGIHELRKDGLGDPVARLTKHIADETALLCFDELQATDVADASLLFRLFEGLFAAGVTIVSTSNHPPASLYTGGVQAERFAKFVTLIESRMHIVSLESPHDYRQHKMQGLSARYIYPMGVSADRFIADSLRALCRNNTPKKTTLEVKGRKIHFPIYDDSIGLFAFDELCGKALGPADYLALCKRCDTVIITGIPKLTPEKRNEAKRFVTLIDTLYEHKIMLLCTSAVPFAEIYAEGDGSFEFARTVSRLNEMQSPNWGK